MLLGLYLLLQSPSGIFALISLACITIVTLKQPAVGGVAFAAFFPVVVSLLAWTEHKETMQQMIQQTNVIVDNSLPQKGQ